MGATKGNSADSSFLGCGVVAAEYVGLVLPVPSTALQGKVL